MVLVFNEELKSLLASVRAKRNFNAKKWIEEKCTKFNEYLKKCGLRGIVINLSGGIDSSVTAALCKYASKMEGSTIEKILCLAQPIHSTASIQGNAYVLAKALDLELVTVDQTAIFDQLAPLVENAIKIEKPSDFARGQLRSYMRTPVAFYASQALSCSGIPSIVVGTGNYDEDGYLFYFCKAGDGISDVQLIHDLHKSEVYAVARELNLPHSVATAVPSADLWEGQTDEDELGITYDFVELYTELLLAGEEAYNEAINKLSNESRELFNQMKEIADKVHKRGLHKKQYPLNIDLLPILG